jgi:hypothetical protein
VLLAAEQVDPGRLQWKLSPSLVLEYESGFPTKWRWALVDVGERKAKTIDRATARLILTGLLAPDAAREFVGWVEKRLGTARADYKHAVDVGHYQTAGANDLIAMQFDDVLAKLREFGLVTP